MVEQQPAEDGPLWYNKPETCAWEVAADVCMPHHITQAPPGVYVIALQPIGGTMN